MVRTVLMVAEKPSLAESIAFHLSNGQAQKRPRAVPVFEYNSYFMGSSAFFKVTSTTGHVFNCDFTAKYQNWDRTEEEDLFSAEVVWKDTSGKVTSHLEHEARGCDVLVLWLDCDREGENICYEVMQVVEKSICGVQNIWRAHFSAITREEITSAFSKLGKPNKNVSDAVTCRQELDLKVGVAFTRFQTKYFQGKYGDLDASVVSYGPCQTPTLGFCVERHDAIVNFKPENFWRLVPIAHRAGGVNMQFDWDRGRVFDEIVARLLHQQVSRSKVAKVIHVHTSHEVKPRPMALNTVEMMKIASKGLGIGPHQAMSIAENLYIRGYISYPRTESTAYPPSFNLHGVLTQHSSHPLWGEYVNSLLNSPTYGMNKPRKGHDAGDHPPITPMRCAAPGELTGDEWRMYEFIARHFIATVSQDCKLLKTSISIELNGEVFNWTGHVIDSPGFVEVMPHMRIQEDKLPANIRVNEDFHLSEIRLQAGQTQPPDYLTESDLIGLMEKNGIGTDASISTHVNNIVERGYCTVQAGRVMKPTKLGVVLVHGISLIDPELVLPLVRSRVEEYVTHIAEGRAKLQEVLQYALDLFFAKFKFFKLHIDVYDALMGASFAPLSQSGKPITRCGNCMRYLKHISTRPQRLYCPYCEVTFALPQGGSIKQYSNFKCPLDNFELVICHIDGGKSMPICPNCYNNPPFEDMVAPQAPRDKHPDYHGNKDEDDNNKQEKQQQQQITITRHMACDECRHPTCEHSLATNYVCDCIDEGCLGCMAFVPHTAGQWKVCCNKCPMMVKLPTIARRVKVNSRRCEECGANCLELVFNENQSPLPSRSDHYVGCVFCDGELSPLCEEVRGKLGVFRRNNAGRGRGGRGRGRGGRGGGGRGSRGRGRVMR